MALKRLHTLKHKRNDFKSKYENICINVSSYIYKIKIKHLFTNMTELKKYVLVILKCDLSLVHSFAIHFQVLLCF